MKIYMLLLSLFILSASSAPTTESTTVTALSEIDEHQIINDVSQTLLEYIYRFGNYLYELFDLEIRSLRFVTSLYTTDNLVLLKRYMKLGMRLTEWVYDMIPDQASDGNTINMLISMFIPLVTHEQANHVEESSRLVLEPRIVHDLRLWREEKTEGRLDGIVKTVYKIIDPR